MTRSNLDSDFSEQLIVHFTEWFEQTPTSFRYWEAILTSDRFILCFVGESYKSLLLKADMGAQRRQKIKKLELDEIATYDENNVVLSNRDLTRISFTGGTWLKRSSLTFEWDNGETSIKLHNVKNSGEQRKDVRKLGTISQFEHIDIKVDKKSGLLNRV